MSLQTLRPLRLPRLSQRSSQCFILSNAFGTRKFSSGRNLRRDQLPSFDPRIFKVSEEVREAVTTGKPVVALETTIYTHGFPYPDNVALASRLESVVRAHGGVPATIGLLHGVARVGLDTEELIEIASGAGKPETMKVSRRDLPYIAGLGLAGRKISGGTTIAGTMILAKMAGIEVFGTGGLGGVHRGGQDTMDISADLTELGRTSVAVISSGCKSFLDLPRTLEYLETQGVGVSTFADGRTGNIDVPAFWTRESGIKSPSVVQNEKEAAAIIYARRLLHMESGLFFANPIPEEWSIPKSEIDIAIEAAVREAEQKGIVGHANTPFILAKIKELTEGKSIPANRALIESNVTRATKVAVELSKLSLEESRDHSFMPAFTSISPAPLLETREVPVAIQPFKAAVAISTADVLVAGSIAVDLSCDYAPSTPTLADASPIAHTSNPAAIQQSIGGVGNNVATAAHMAGGSSSARLCSLVADDLAGHLIMSTLADRGLDTQGINMLKSSPSTRTAQYVAINDANKDLHVAMADMNIIGTPREEIPSMCKAAIAAAQPKWVVVDANWHASTIRQWTQAAKSAGAKVAYEPVSVAKSKSIFPPIDVHSTYSTFPDHEIDIATPNKHELAAMHEAGKINGYFDSQSWWEVIDALGIPSSGARSRLVSLTHSKLVDQGIPQQAIQLLPFIPTVITKLGAEGVLVTILIGADDWRLTSPATAPYILSRCTNGTDVVGGVYMRLFSAAKQVDQKDIVSVNGVGDTFLGVLVAGLAKGIVLDEQLLHLAQKAAVMTLQSSEAVSPAVEQLAVELQTLSRTWR